MCPSSCLLCSWIVSPAHHNQQFSPSRQKISVKDDKKALEDETKLADVLGEQLRDGELQVKDLGSQIGWRTVFLVEYVRLLLLDLSAAKSSESSRPGRFSFIRCSTTCLKFSMARKFNIALCRSKR